MAVLNARVVRRGCFALVLVAGISVGVSLTAAAALRSWPPVSTSAGQDSAEETLEGSLEMLIEDSANGSRTLYFLKRSSDRVPLRFVTPPRNLRTGMQLRVRGNYETGGSFRVVSFERVAAAE